MTLAATAATVRIGDRAILANASVTVHPGKVTALIGPNGAGKSTLVKVMSGDIVPQCGSVRIGGRLLSAFGTRELALIRAVMAQAPAVMFDYTVEEVVRMGWVLDDVYLRDVADRAFAEVALACDIGTLLKRTYRTLSGGEQRQVQFARALLQIWRDDGCTERRYLMLDEPTANLDMANELAVLRMAREVARQGVGVLAVLHDLNLAARFADQLTLLQNGCVVAAGSPGDVLESDRLGAVYGTRIAVEWHQGLNRLVMYS